LDRLLRWTETTGFSRSKRLVLISGRFRSIDKLAQREARIEQVAVAQSIVHKFIILQVFPMASGAQGMRLFPATPFFLALQFFFL